MAACLAVPFVTMAGELAVKTFTFKPQLQADVYASPGESNRPVVVFIHGGALMMGGRGMSTNAGSLLRALVNAGSWSCRSTTAWRPR